MQTLYASDPRSVSEFWEFVSDDASVKDKDAGGRVYSGGKAFWESLKKKSREAAGGGGGCGASRLGGARMSLMELYRRKSTLWRCC